MRWTAKAILAFYLVCSFCSAQSGANAPASQLEQTAAQARGLYEKHEYSQAAELLVKLGNDSAVVGLPEWPDTLYDLACYQAMVGNTAQALASLNQAVYLGGTVSAERLEKDSDLVSLRGEPDFRQLVTQLSREDSLWKDNPALATGYKPILTIEEKVAGLSKFWSEARFNFPFFGRLQGMDWDALYMEYLKQVREAKTTADYYRMMMRFAAALKDGHTNVYPPPELYDALYAAPGLRTALVDGEVVVTRIIDPALRSAGWKTGDLIVKINGLDARQYAKSEIEPYMSSSTEQDRNIRTFNYFLLSGDVNQSLTLTVKDAAGKQDVRKISRLSSQAFMALWKPTVISSEFKLLPGNFAYLAVNEFEDDSGLKTLLDHLSQIQSSPGLILDLRRNGGGNSQNGISILQVLASAPFHWERERTPKYRAVYRAYYGVSGWEVLDSTMFAPDPQHHVTVPVAVLAGAATFSAAEDFVAIFDSMHRGTIVGEPTAGSTGQPLNFKLPGGGSARICTKDTRTPEGKVYMGIGIQPQVDAKPSIADIQNGSDPVVEKAVETLGKRKSTVP